MQNHQRQNKTNKQTKEPIFECGVVINILIRQSNDYRVLYNSAWRDNGCCRLIWQGPGSWRYSRAKPEIGQYIQCKQCAANLPIPRKYRFLQWQHSARHTTVGPWACWVAEHWWFPRGWDLCTQSRWLETYYKSRSNGHTAWSILLVRKHQQQRILHFTVIDDLV